jgi:hypothetical protein
MFGFGRRKASLPIFAVGLSLMLTGIGWDITAVWIAGLALFAGGIALLHKRRSQGN